MMITSLSGIAQRRLEHLRRAVSAHQAVMEGIATHAEKEHARRERYAATRQANQAISGSFKGIGQSV